LPLTYGLETQQAYFKGKDKGEVNKKRKYKQITRRKWSKW